MLHVLERVCADHIELRQSLQKRAFNRTVIGRVVSLSLYPFSAYCLYKERSLPSPMLHSSMP